MSTISASRPSHKRPHISSPLSNQPDDPSFKRQKTVRTYISTTSTNTNINSRPHPLSSSSPSINSSEFSSSQPDSRGPPLPADFFDTTSTSTSSSSTIIPTILPIGSQNRTPLPTPESDPPITTDINEAEWAAFKAEIAEAEATVSATTTTTITIPPSAVISAAPTGRDGRPSTEDSEALEDEATLDREDAQNKLVEEFEEMESLESRVQKLKEQREALRAKAAESAAGRMDITINRGGDDEVEDEEDEEDDWIHFSR
ncbi:hypothetical protein L211DRAFT_832240 [Terfezia boudieri ATCC MYA-4762]|uniref:Uncharacterized protein n=1 Tax=Terfezia boudieri ATCC MYA-4762 TaxID=1051890 RepID=A0A3N4MAV4_9PEZI|nr:hypothetical protein L211DRAFT_832240 [Terfezia boudieri ATCC MYA-4762]